MKLNEVITILVDRIGFEDDGTVGSVSLDSSVLQSDSGRYFQDEHSAVTLQNIRDCQPKSSMTNQEFNDYLNKLKKRCARKVLVDAMERDEVNEDVLNAYPTIFDNALSMQMTILVSEIIITSVRVNKIERMTDSWIRKLNYDIFREVTNASKSVSRYSLGIATRYGYEIRTVQRRFGQQRNLLKSITKGEAIPNISEQENSDLE